MKITIAENVGFCFGVKKALEQVEKLNKPAYVLGKLIHNPQVIGGLEKEGIKSIENTDSVEEGSTIIIPAHGVPDNTINNLAKQGFKIVDCTCSLVKKVHEITKEEEKQGYTIIILGDKEHSEVKGINGNLKNSVIISGVDGVNKLDKEKRYCLVSQTTQDEGKFNEVAEELKKSVKELKVYNTICVPTKHRQSGSVELAKESELMLVVGGKMSANTKRLTKRCSEFVKTYHIESEKELEAGWFKDKNKIGITAGASTPDYIIKKVVEKIENEF
ncbi:4-hydroxy-3-methylbut-2-enyl diphosphate reductase [Candidatus Woesearchaeota archaeon]|nr:4-hydroxy-3-methylbut-2-enyl diphosphate reductase [Candidatus Woesearchaeota archaeon]